jgi:hypothetical protein
MAMLRFRAMPTTATPTVLIDKDELSARISALAQEIRADFPGTQLLELVADGPSQWNPAIQTPIGDTQFSITTG